MKLLQEWIDSKYKVNNYLYQLDSGLRVFHTKNLQSTDTYISYIVKAGAYFEKDLNVPNGTAHLLEHLLFKPNDVFKTINKIDEFEFGTRSRAKISVNGGTSIQRMFLWGFAHQSREIDLAKRIVNIVTYPIELIHKHINDERKVILSELSRKVKPEKDSVLKFYRFAFKDKAYNTNFHVLGEFPENIKAITAEDIIKYYTTLFTIPNSIIAIQSPNDISKELEVELEKIAKGIAKNGNATPVIHDEKLVDEFKTGYFFNTETTGINTLFLKLDDYKQYKELNYKKFILEDLHTDLIQFLAFNELREKKGLFYGISYFTINDPLWKWALTGFSVTTPEDKYLKLLNALPKLINETTFKYLKTKQGKKWFESKISSFLFPHTIEFNPDYAKNKAATILGERNIFENDIYKKEVLDTSIEKLTEHMQKTDFLSNLTMWVDTHIDIKKTQKIIEKSELYKYNKEKN